jgi:hypothetical protein
MLIIEHSEKMSLKDVPGFQRQRSYGLVQFSFFTPHA